jgi:sarcosine oxidase
METFDAIVVGLGAHGSAAAAELARRGLRVLGLERFERGETFGSSGGRSRMIRIAHYENPSYVPLARASWAAWRALEVETGVAILAPRPGLYAGPAASDVVAGSLAAARAGAVGHEILDADAIRRRWPVFAPAQDTVGVVDVDAGVLDADRAIEAQRLVAERDRAVLRFGARAVDWRPAAGGGFEVETDDGVIVGGELLVLAVGPWVSSFVPDLGLPLVVERQPVLWLEPADGASAGPLGLDDLPLWLWATGAGTMYGFPWDDELGLKVARHHGGATVDPDAVDRAVRPADEAVVRDFVRARMPAMDGPVRSSTVCLYTNAPDDEFIIDRHPAAPGVAFASACSGHGFKFAPIVGELLADLVLGTVGRWPLEPFRADRFRSEFGG